MLHRIETHVEDLLSFAHSGNGLKPWEKYAILIQMPVTCGFWLKKLFRLQGSWNRLYSGCLRALDVGPNHWRVG